MSKSRMTVTVFSRGSPEMWPVQVRKGHLALAGGCHAVLNFESVALVWRWDQTWPWVRHGRMWSHLDTILASEH